MFTYKVNFIFADIFFNNFNKFFKSSLLSSLIKRKLLIFEKACLHSLILSFFVCFFFLAALCFWCTWDLGLHGFVISRWVAEARPAEITLVKVATALELIAVWGWEYSSEALGTSPRVKRLEHGRKALILIVGSWPLVDSCDDGHFASSEVGERSPSSILSRYQECCSLPYSVGDSPYHRDDSVSEYLLSWGEKAWACPVWSNTIALECWPLPSQILSPSPATKLRYKRVPCLHLSSCKGNGWVLWTACQNGHVRNLVLEYWVRLFNGTWFYSLPSALSFVPVKKHNQGMLTGSCHWMPGLVTWLQFWGRPKLWTLGDWTWVLITLNQPLLQHAQSKCLRWLYWCFQSCWCPL